MSAATHSPAVGDLWATSTEVWRVRSVDHDSGVMVVEHAGFGGQSAPSPAPVRRVTITEFAESAQPVNRSDSR